MNCRNCGNEKAWHTVSRYDSAAEEWTDCCDGCGLEGGGDVIPDVYLGRLGQKFANLCDDMGRPIEIQSKRHKKEVMDRLGVSEAGGTINGARYGSKTWIEGSREYRKKQFEKDRPVIRETLRRWKEKGQVRP